MDVLCDTLLLEEILPRLLPKHLLRLGAASRRYNALARRPDFAARYWRRAGVIFQPLEQPKEFTPRFLTGGGRAGDEAAALVHGADLAFLPGPSAREEAYLRLDGSDPDGGFAVLHSAGGLLLCSRGRTRAVHLYVCNPVTCQWVALPELPLPVCKRHCGHLTVAGGGGAFTVVVANHASHWRGPRGGQLDLRVFASHTGRWEARRFPATVISDDVEFDDASFLQPPMLGPSGTSYWTLCNLAVAYNSSSSAAAGATTSDDAALRVITLPDRHLVEGGRCIGERCGGGLRYLESNRKVLQVWDAPPQEQDGIGTSSTWTLVHRVAAAEVMQLERNPEAAAFLRNTKPSTWDQYRHLKPAGVHPTDDDVIFVALPGAVVAYSIEHGKISLACTNDDDFVTAADAFQYVHPPFLLRIPEIRSSFHQENGGGSTATSLVTKTADGRKKRKIFTEPR